MSYNQPESDLSWRQIEQHYLLSTKETKNMLDEDAIYFRGDGSRKQYPDNVDINRLSGDVDAILAHRACNDRNRQGMELGHLTGNERTHTFTLTHNTH